MRREPYVRWYVETGLFDCEFLCAEDELAIRRIIDLVLVNGGPLPDNDRELRVATKLLKLWKRTKARLIEREMLVAANGFIGIGPKAPRFTDYQVRAPHRPERLDVSLPEWRILRAAVFARDGFACVYCGDAEGPLECDHVHPRVLGGLSTPENLATACVGCNRSKGGRTLEQWKGVLA